MFTSMQFTYGRRSDRKDATLHLIHIMHEDLSFGKKIICFFDGLRISTQLGAIITLGGTKLLLYSRWGCPCVRGTISCKDTWAWDFFCFFFFKNKTHSISYISLQLIMLYTNPRRDSIVPSYVEACRLEKGRGPLLDEG